MSLAASLPAEVLLVIFEHLFFTKDLLCAALVNRAWRAACLSLKSVWRRHWKFLKHNDAHRRRVLARNEDEVDWFAESTCLFICFSVTDPLQHPQVFAGRQLGKLGSSPRA